jgi:hypothetical protein
MIFEIRGINRAAQGAHHIIIDGFTMAAPTELMLISLGFPFGTVLAAPILTRTTALITSGSSTI